MGSIEQRTLRFGWVVPVILAACATAGSGASGEAPCLPRLRTTQALRVLDVVG